MVRRMVSGSRYIVFSYIYHILQVGWGRLAATAFLPPTHNQGPYDTSLAVIHHKKPLKVHLSRRLNASSGPDAHRTPLLLHATD